MRLFALSVISCLVLVASSLRGEDAAAEYNLLFIAMTNTRADHLGPYGYARKTSPNIDRLAAQSLVFRDIYSHASWTLPAVMSLFTSQYPFSHGLLNREKFTSLPPMTPTFVEVLKENGYATRAFVGNRDYSPKYGKR
jgi:arylsulfatase A-like enzyme